MKIQNLGPIKELEIDLNKMNVFVGENETGKTIAAYAIFAFVYWFNANFFTEILSEDDIKDVLYKKKISISIEDAKDKIINQAIKLFNSFDFEVFDSFFNHTGIYTKDSKIKITESDVEALVIDPKFTSRWYYDWNFRKRTPDFANDFVESIGPGSENVNRIVCTKNNNKIDIEYFPAKGVSQNNLQDQFDGLKDDTKGFMIINISVQNIIFKSFPGMRPVYLPAERIGINVFRPYLNLNRLNKVTPESPLNERQNQEEFRRYVFPIENYIRFVNNNAENLNKIDDSVDNNNLIKELIPGKFIYDKETDSVRYNLADTSQMIMDFEVISSSLKSIFGLDLFFKSKPEGRWLFFDEPEMNLHPEKQKTVANLTYNLMKKGIRLVVSTHSDYYVKQLINCVLKDKLNGQENNEINVYEFKDGTATKLNNIFDIDEPVNNFDNTTRKINNEYYDIIDKLETEDESNE